MTRSVWKPPFCEINIKNKVFTVEKKKIWSRRSVILPYCINKRFLIYNGKNFIPLHVSMEMIGHKFGEFAITRKKPNHKSKKNMYKSKLPKKR